MSLRTEPRGLSEKVAALEEWARKIDLTGPAAIVAAIQGTGELHTLLHHVPGTIAVAVYEPYFPLFDMTLLQVRGNLDTAPSGGSCVFDVLVDGVSIFSGAKPTIAAGDLIGTTVTPTLGLISADQRIEIEVEQVNGAKGLVSAIEFTLVGGANALTGDVAGGGGDVTLSGAPSYNITTQTTNYTAAANDLVLADASAGNITITLPAASGNSGKVIIVKKIDSSANTVTIDGNASETIDGATTLVLSAQWDAAYLISNGTGWFAA